MKLTHASLFSGIGGFDLAANWMGWHNIFNCEINTDLQYHLKQSFPEAENFGDITQTNFTHYANKINVLTGGFPCQPFSGAGSKKGQEDKRYLWPQMLRAIREIKPQWVVAENVYGLINNKNGLVFEQICSQMEVEGYAVQAFIIPASAVNAWHRLDRVWLIAHSNSKRQTFLQHKPAQRCQRQTQPQPFGIFKNGNEREVLRANSRNINGLPAELDKIEAYGNAIVPQLALKFFCAIEQYTELTDINKERHSI